MSARIPMVRRHFFKVGDRVRMVAPTTFGGMQYRVGVVEAADNNTFYNASTDEGGMLVTVRWRDTARRSVVAEHDLEAVN